MVLIKLKIIMKAQINANRYCIVSSDLANKTHWIK
jgi:hypothetical protein